MTLTYNVKATQQIGSRLVMLKFTWYFYCQFHTILIFYMSSQDIRLSYLFFVKVEDTHKFQNTCYHQALPPRFCFVSQVKRLMFYTIKKNTQKKLSKKQSSMYRQLKELPAVYSGLTGLTTPPTALMAR